jgi:hypothetical protein
MEPMHDAKKIVLVLQEDRLDRSQPRACALVTLEVENYDRWKAAFDTGREHRERNGIVGYAISRSASQPNQVQVQVQASTTDQLRAIFGAGVRTENMKKAGVLAPPQVSYLTP